MKTLLIYIYNFLSWLFILAWGKFLDFLTAGKRFISNWNEIITIPLALVLWYLSPTFLRWLDPTAATFDSGVLQNYLLAAIGLLLFNGVAWLIVKLTFPGIYRYLDSHMENAVENSPTITAVSEREKMFNLSTLQKCVISLSIFFFYFLALVLLAKG